MAWKKNENWSYALPADSPHQVSNTAQRLGINGSSPSLRNRPSLAQNVDNVLESLRRSSDHTLNTATLVSVTLYGKYVTRDYHNLDGLILRFHPQISPSTEGYRNELMYVNDPQLWDIWHGPRRHPVPRRVWDMYGGIVWREIQAVMDIDMASRWLKVAGYLGPFWRVTIAMWMEIPLSYCFEHFDAQGMSRAVRVEVVTKAVRQQEEGCPGAKE
ncbi:MAG: hypothetical protein Q9182_006304 [Xanthomendoza sp. 2 TL-2023]